jgi:hypothetical protein
MKPSGLVVIATLPVPPAVANHRFVLEAAQVAASLAKNVDPTRQVIGTAKSISQVQLYGWNTDTASHSDNTGFIYGLCLNEGSSSLCARDETAENSQPVLVVEVGQGTLFRLDDHFTHWTKDSHPRIAAFLGPFKQPDDDLAFNKMQEAIALLTGQAYYRAPRISEGFLIQREDECLATLDFLSYNRMLKSDAKEQGAFILECGECGAPAVSVDQHWPIYDDRSACATCLALDVDTYKD